MLRLVKAELFKLFKNKTFMVLCIVGVLLSALMILLSSPLLEKVLMDSLGEMSPADKQAIMEQMGAASATEQVFVPGRMGIHLIAKDMMNPTAFEVYHSSFGAGLTEILIGILIAAFFAKEYTQGTIKNTLAYGKRRAEFYLAKFIAIVVGIVVILLTLTLISTIGFVIMNGWGEPFEVSHLVSMASTFIAAVMTNAAVASIIMIIAILVKSNGGTIGITAGLFILVPMLLSFLYGIYPWFDKITKLTPYYNTALSTFIYATNGEIIKSIIIALATICICLFIGVKIFAKQDIK